MFKKRLKFKILSYALNRAMLNQSLRIFQVPELIFLPAIFVVHPWIFICLQRIQVNSVNSKHRDIQSNNFNSIILVHFE